MFMQWPHRFGDGAITLGTVLSWVLLALIIALLVVLAIRFFRPRDGAWRGPVGGPDSPEEILHRRFANGEIDVDEYERRMAALRAQRPPRA